MVCNSSRLTYSCNGALKPDVVFFGQNLDPHIREAAQQRVSDASSLLVIGSSLRVYSAFRLVTQAIKEGKKVVILSNGPTRADGLNGVEKIDTFAEDVLKEI
jgi:NAD-dependent deacetylase sirtuin 4